MRYGHGVSSRTGARASTCRGSRLREVRENDRSSLGRHCRLLSAGEQSLARLRRGAQPKIRVIQRRAYGLRNEEYLAAQGPYLHAAGSVGRPRIICVTWVVLRSPPIGNPQPRRTRLPNSNTPLWTCWTTQVRCPHAHNGKKHFFVVVMAFLTTTHQMTSPKGMTSSKGSPFATTGSAPPSPRQGPRSVRSHSKSGDKADMVVRRTRAICCRKQMQQHEAPFFRSPHRQWRATSAAR